MIYIERTINISDNSASIEEPVILYKGDRNIEVQFIINNSPFKYRTGIDLTYGQLVIKRPNTDPIFSEPAKLSSGKVLFVITGEMIDDLIELGDYDFQIRLLNADKTSRATLPPVSAGILIKEPVCEEDGVNYASVNYTKAATGETLDVFDDNGDYIRTDWANGDLITDSKLNKIEAALYEINNGGGSDLNIVSIGSDNPEEPYYFTGYEFTEEQWYGSEITAVFTNVIMDYTYYANDLVKLYLNGYDADSGMKWLLVVRSDGQAYAYEIHGDGTIATIESFNLVFSTDIDNIWNHMNNNLVSNNQLQQYDSTIRQDFDSDLTNVYNTIDGAVSYIENDVIGGKLEEYDTSIKGYINNNCVTNQALDDFANNTTSFVEQSLNDFADTCEEQFINNTELEEYDTSIKSHINNEISNVNQDISDLATAIEQNFNDFADDIENNFITNDQLEEYDTSIKNHITNEVNTLKNSINTDFSNYTTYVETNFATKDQLDNALGDIESLLGGI